MNRLLYALHKWISAAAFVQLAIWTISGFLFTAISQESIRSAPAEGAHTGAIDDAPPVPIARALELASPASGRVSRVELRATPSGLYYVVHGESATVRVDARAGTLAPVTPGEAGDIAQRDQPGAPAVRATSRIESSPPIEYRDCESGTAPCPPSR